MFKCYDIPCLSAMDIPRFTRNMTLCFVFYMFKCYAMDIPRFTRNICFVFYMLCLSAILTFKCYDIPCFSAILTFNSSLLLTGIVHMFKCYAMDIPRFTRNICTPYYYSLYMTQYYSLYMTQYFSLYMT